MPLFLFSNFFFFSSQYDSSSELPKEITADVIILGDKYDFTLEDIEERIFGKHKTVTVQFS